jgi:hypothetical protein
MAPAATRAASPAASTTRCWSCAATSRARSRPFRKAGAIARGLVYAQRLAESNPLAEHAHRRLMRLHYLRGDRAAAIDVFERFEQCLKDEQGTPPSAETIELLATIERGGAALPARRAVVPASLIRPPRLVGRERELMALDHAWSARRTFLLVGEAGIGKSRLLQEFSAGRDGIVALRARPGDAGIAYAVLARLLRALLAEHALPLERGTPAGARPRAARAGRPGDARGRSAAAAAASRRRRDAGRRRRRRPAGGGRRRPSLRRRRQHRVRAGAGAIRRARRAALGLRAASRRGRRAARQDAAALEEAAGSRRSRCSRSGWRSSRC